MSLPAASSLDPQGPIAAEIADVWWLMLALGAAVFVVVAVLLTVGLARRRGEQEEEFGEPIEPSVGRIWILGGGVALPLLVITAVFGFSTAAMQDIGSAGASDQLTIEVEGSQWWWSVRYPDAGFTTANEIHIPAGRPVELRLTSSDVIHSFWVPALAGKLDLLPGRTNTLVLQADAPGRYGGVCAEFCGLQHAKMAVVVVAQAPDDFEQWLARQSAPASEPSSDDERQGGAVFLAAGCPECHTVRGTPADGTVGPDLTHLASRETLGAITVLNTPEHLAAWVDDPHDVKEGVKMPATELPDEDMAALLAYLQGLD